MAGVLSRLKCKNKMQLGFYSIENGKIGYGCVFILLKTLKQDTAEIFFY